MSTDKIPETDSIQELAQFWDAHDLTDFEDELEEMGEGVFERETAVTIHLSPKDAEAVKEKAKLEGMDSADLIRQWILDKVQTSS